MIDEFEMLNECPNIPVHDMIINIKSLSKLKEGWEIKYFGEKENIKENILTKKKVIAVLGNIKKGKTFILQKISNLNFDNNNNIPTEGLSIKFPKDKQYVLLDTLGNNAPKIL